MESYFSSLGTEAMQLQWKAILLILLICRKNTKNNSITVQVLLFFISIAIVCQFQACLGTDTIYTVSPQSVKTDLHTVHERQDRSRLFHI
jgi:hypothetical protein